jgi:hypothetical protein
MAIEPDDDVRYGIVYVPTFWNERLGEDQYLLNIELEAKPEYGKFSGSLGFPSETRKNHDCDDWCTYARLVYEELGVVVDGEILLEFVPIGCIFIHKVELTVIQRRVTTRFVSRPNVCDVKHGDWYTKKEIYSKGTLGDEVVRMETVPALNLVLSQV